MTAWSAEDVAATLKTGAVAHRTFSHVSTDTRTIQPDGLFLALTGARYDGHHFLEAARESGATGAVVRRDTPAVEGLALFEVDDPLVALGRLAHARRQQIAGPVVAVTGTNGKTATREMLAQALGTRWPVHATRANHNNLIGVPQTILAAADAAEALVIEAGTSEPGEIARLREIIDPTVAVITNVSAAHLEGFGSLDAVLEEKVSLVWDVPLAVVGTRPPELCDAASRSAERVVSAGLGSGAQIGPDDWMMAEDGRVTVTFRSRRVRLPLIGRHQGENAMLALAVSAELDLDREAVASALEEVVVPGGRCEVLPRGNLRILHDAYNANPASLEASLDTASALQADRRLVVVVGSMLELGPESDRLHREAAEAIVRAQPHLVAATGRFVPAFEDVGWGGDDRLLVSDDVERLGRALRERLHGDEFVLVKASRGVRLERLIPLLTDEDEE